MGRPRDGMMMCAPLDAGMGQRWLREVVALRGHQILVGGRRHFIRHSPQIKVGMKRTYTFIAMLINDDGVNKPALGMKSTCIIIYGCQIDENKQAKIYFPFL